MTSKPKQSSASEVGGALSRVNRLGSAAEQIFSRLYLSLNRRSHMQQAEQEKTRALDLRNARLMLQRRDTEIERLNGILASIDEGIIMQDNEGRIVLVNNAARKLLGNQKAFWESELGSLFEAYRDINHLDSELEPLGEPARVQVNNRILGAQIAAVANSQGDRLGTMIVLRDVTRDTLSDRLKEQFITAISHELRTPMAAIKGMSEVILGQPEGKTIPRRFLETIGRNVDILDRMIVELLDITEMSANAFSIRQDTLNVEDLIESVIRGMKPEAARAQLDIGLMVRDSGQLFVVGDDQRLRWALGHLLQNSVRYTEANGHIVVMVRLENAQQVAVRIADTGVGISDKDLPHIFERFYRGEPRAKNGKLIDPRGLGQGLFIARRVSEAHKGYLTVFRPPNGGSVFTMTLPAVAPPVGS